MNPTVTADLPRRLPRARLEKLPASQRCVGLMNGEASYPNKGCAADITYGYMAFVMADGTVRMSGTNHNHEFAMHGNAYNPQHLRYLVWDNRTNADDSVTGRPRYVVGSFGSVAMLTDTGDVVTWGHNGHGQQGRGHTTGNGYARSIDATDIGRTSGIPGRDVVKLDIPQGYPTSNGLMYALCRDGGLWAWGYGGYGSLAQGDTNHSYSPARCRKTGDVVLEDVIDFWPGHGNNPACFALTRDGRLWAVGDNHWGKLGVDDGTTTISTPTRVELPDGVTARMISTGGAWSNGHYHSTVMLGSDGRVYSCGKYGQHGA